MATASRDAALPHGADPPTAPGIRVAHKRFVERMIDYVTHRDRDRVASARECRAPVSAERDTPSTTVANGSQAR